MISSWTRTLRVTSKSRWIVTSYSTTIDRFRIVLLIKFISNVFSQAVVWTFKILPNKAAYWNIFKKSPLTRISQAQRAVKSSQSNQEFWCLVRFYELDRAENFLALIPLQQGYGEYKFIHKRKSVGWNIDFEKKFEYTWKVKWKLD